MPSFRQFRAAPNLLTLLRLFILPFLVIEILDGRFRTAFLLLVVAGITDGLDGLLARWLRQHTRLGQYLDPIADKLMLSTLFVVLTHVGLIPRYVTVLVFSRDLGILLISALLFATSSLRDFRPSFFGKLNTLVQIVTVVAVMCERFSNSTTLTSATGWLVRAVAILAPVSAAQYAWLVFQRMNTPTAATEAAAASPPPPPHQAPLSPPELYR